MYLTGPNWPIGEYGILSRDKCPSNWYEFIHCIDTENDNNQDELQNFMLGPGYKCDRTSVTFRYCFKGPYVPTEKGGFWTRSGRRSSAFVIKNVRGMCSTFGKKGGSIELDDEESSNKNAYGNRIGRYGLNGRKYDDYSPSDFIYTSATRTRLTFCEIGYGKPKKSSRLYMDVGKFNNQKFGFFISPAGVCPIINSPYGFLVGKKENFFLDNENYYNRNRVLEGRPPVFLGYDSRWAVCEYNPYNGRKT